MEYFVISDTTAWQAKKFLAVREGFEPSIRYSRIHAFQACSFNHSDTSPQDAE